MHSLIFVDERLEPLANMLLWSDGRAAQKAEELLQDVGREIYSRTGTPDPPDESVRETLLVTRTRCRAFK